MKKAVVTLAFIIVLLVMVSSHSGQALANSETQSYIESLQKLIESLKTQVTELLEQATPDQGPSLDPQKTDVLNTYCPVIDRVLSRGASGNDVRELQEFLRSTGDYTYTEITGYYGPITEAAVQSFQRKASVVSSGDAQTTGFGVFGPLTREASYRYCKVPSDTTACTMEYTPVCGRITDCIGPDDPNVMAPCYLKQKTYANICLLEADGATFLHDGTCGE